MWRTHFDNNVSAESSVQDVNVKLKVNDTCKKNENLTTKFETSHHEDVLNKVFQDTKLSKLEDHLSMNEKNYNECKAINNLIRQF